MTKKDAIDFCLKNSRKSKMKALISVLIAGMAVGSIYKNAYNVAVYRTGVRDIKFFAEENDEITLTINGKKV